MEDKTTAASDSEKNEMAIILGTGDSHVPPSVDDYEEDGKCTACGGAGCQYCDARHDVLAEAFKIINGMSREELVASYSAFLKRTRDAQRKVK